MCIFSHDYKNTSIIFNSDTNLIKIIDTTNKNIQFSVPKEQIFDKKDFLNYVKKYHTDFEKSLQKN